MRSGVIFRYATTPSTNMASTATNTVRGFFTLNFGIRFTPLFGRSAPKVLRVFRQKMCRLHRQAPGGFFDTLYKGKFSMGDFFLQEGGFIIYESVTKKEGVRWERILRQKLDLLI